MDINEAFDDCLPIGSLTQKKKFWKTVQECSIVNWIHEKLDGMRKYHVFTTWSCQLKDIHPIYLFTSPPLGDIKWKNPNTKIRQY